MITDVGIRTGGRGEDDPIVLRSQGSFAVGGTVVTGPDGDTAHVDHAYVQYQIPVNARKYPLVMWHGGGQFSKTWESTPDGRDGFQNIFLRRGFATYIIDQPRRGRGGRGEAAVTLPTVQPMNALLYNIFRLGCWVPPEQPRFFDNVQFPRDAAALEQYWRQTAPSTGTDDLEDPTRILMTDASSALLDKIGPSLLLTHSASGQFGWITRARNANVKAIVSYEPASFVFPPDELPPEIETRDPLAAALAKPIVIPRAGFDKLTEIPIQLVYGDNIEQHNPSHIAGAELWRVNVQRAVHFRDVVNRHGGQVEILNLPEAGLHGNTHFPFSDLNNIAVADLLSAFLRTHGLDPREAGLQ
jgi:hypothetical protein